MKLKLWLLIVLFNFFGVIQAEPFAEDGLNAQISLPRLEATTKEDELRAEKLAKYINATYPVREQHAEDIVSIAIENANKHNLEAEMILAIIAVESMYNTNAKSGFGARGLMQVIPKYHPEKLGNIGGADGLYEVDKNIHVGTKILAEYLKWDKGNMTKALLRYNGSYSDKSQKYAKKVLHVYDRLKRLDHLLINDSDVKKLYGLSGAMVE